MKEKLPLSVSCGVGPVFFTFCFQFKIVLLTFSRYKRYEKYFSMIHNQIDVINAG